MYDEVVMKAGHLWSFVDQAACKCLIRFGIDCAFQADRAILNNDVNGRQRLDGVFLQRGVFKNGPVDVASQLVIAGRMRKNFYVVNNARHSFEAFYRCLRVHFQRWPPDLTRESDFFAVDEIVDIVEDRIEGKFLQLVADRAHQRVLDFFFTL